LRDRIEVEIGPSAHASRLYFERPRFCRLWAFEAAAERVVHDGAEWTMPFPRLFIQSAGDIVIQRECGSAWHGAQ
jgi:hypothetical protein